MTGRVERKVLAAVCAFALAPLPLAGMAQGSANEAGRNQGKSEEASDASKHVSKSVQVVQQMQKDSGMQTLMREAKGMFIVPDYGRAALGVGSQGGAGVLVVHQGGKWTGPGFYNFGGISVGAQAGISAGPIAMLLMNDKALNAFSTNNKFALSADAGITIVAYDARAHGTAGRGDVVIWSGNKGAFANVSVGVTDVNFDAKETRALYDKDVAPQDIVSGKASSTQAGSLLQALPK